eukprot:COSAG02_NODE_348_length_24081_cov_19.231007_9_plen_437_part_00
MAEEGMPPLAAEWSVEEVAAWVLTLEGIDDLEAVAAKVREEELDGVGLMAYKDRLEVKSDLSLSGGKAARLFLAIEQLRAAPARPADAVAGGGTGGAAPTAYVIHGPGSEIWTHADSLLQNTWMKHGLHEFTRLVEVKEIQNAPMRERYEAFKAAMRAGVTNGNEMLLFHGCGIDAIESIAEKGFLRSFQNTEAWQRFGPGFYFALQVGFGLCHCLSASLSLAVSVCLCLCVSLCVSLCAPLPFCRSLCTCSLSVSLCLSLSLSLCLSLSVSLSVCLSICLPICLSALPLCLSSFLPLSLYLLSICLSLSLSVSVSVSLSLSLSVCLFVYLVYLLCLSAPLPFCRSICLCFSLRKPFSSAPGHSSCACRTGVQVARVPRGRDGECPGRTAPPHDDPVQGGPRQGVQDDGEHGQAACCARGIRLCARRCDARRPSEL